MRHFVRAAVCLAFSASLATAADVTVTLDLAGLAALTQTVEPASYAVVLENLLPRAGVRYEVVIRRENIPIATLPLEGIATPSLERLTGGAVCDELAATVSALMGADHERSVPALAAHVRQLLNQCTDQTIVKAANAALSQITRTLPAVRLRANQRLTVTVTRKSTAGEAPLTWSLVLETEPRGEWMTTWGVSFVPDDDERFFAKAIDGGKFQITREREENGVRPIPSVYFTWLSNRKHDSPLAISPTAGIGLKSDAPAFFGGVAFTFNQNIGANMGVAVTGFRRLNGKYSANDQVSENLTDEQLHRRVFRPALAAAVTYRFGRNPFAQEKAEPPATPAPPAPPSPADTGTTPAPVAPPTPSPGEADIRDPDIRLHFDAKGALADQTSLSSLMQRVASATDVFIVSHGWWNNVAVADCFYRRIIGGIQRHQPEYLTPDRFKPVFVSVYWPSALFPMEPGDCVVTESTASRVESAASTFSRERVQAWAAAAFPDAATRPQFAAQVARVAALFEKERVSSLSNAESDEIARVLVEWQRATDAGAPVSEGPERAIFSGTAEQMAQAWRERPEPRQEAGFALPKKWLNFGNAFTFWTMKERAGVVGSRGLYEVVKALQPARDRGVRVHLIGHSFGGKLVTASLVGSGGTRNHVDSLIILQGAFSQFAFATNDQIRALGVSVDRSGLYVDVLSSNLVSGPIVVTRSAADVPNRFLYPAGVALVNDVTEVAGVARYGSLGANGLRGPQVLALSLASQSLGDLQTTPRAVNVDGSTVIMGHSDLVKPQVFKLIWDAVELAGTRVP